MFDWDNKTHYTNFYKIYYKSLQTINQILEIWLPTNHDSITQVDDHRLLKVFMPFTPPQGRRRGQQRVHLNYVPNNMTIERFEQPFPDLVSQSQQIKVILADCPAKPAIPPQSCLV